MKNSPASGTSGKGVASLASIGLVGAGSLLVNELQPGLGLSVAYLVGASSNAAHSKNCYTTSCRRRVCARVSAARHPLCFHLHSLVCSPCLFTCAHSMSSKVVKSLTRLHLSETYTQMLLVKTRSCLLICAGQVSYSPTLP